MRALRAADRELLKSLFGDVGHPLASRCAVEILNSPRFAAFLDTNRSKIGKKARSLEGAGRWPDLWLELWTAAQVISDRRFELWYENYAAGAQIIETCSVESATAELGADAGRGEDAIFQRYGLLGGRDYQRHIGRLSGVLRVADWDTASTVQKCLWRNPAARHVLPDDLARALLA
jgi:hypothetical protein